MECNNYWEISFLNINYKIFPQLLTKYLQAYVGETVGEYQCAFCRGQSTTDHIFRLRMIFEKSYKYNVQIHQMYINQKQEQDSSDISWWKLWMSLEYQVS
jgi:hypothetical protein